MRNGVVPSGDTTASTVAETHPSDSDMAISAVEETALGGAIEKSTPDGTVDSSEDGKEKGLLTGSDAASLECSVAGEERRYRGLCYRVGEALTYTPKTCRYDPESPPNFSLAMNFLFASAAMVTVANLYYNQAILYRIADTFDVAFEKASTVATLMQAGYACGLLFLCPLGDKFRRRPFILLLVALTAILWIVLCLTHSFNAFVGVSFLCGMTTVTPQLMLPLVGDLAPVHRRATCLSIVAAGMSLGMLVARLVAGILANYTAWRNIYWFGFGAQWVVAGLLYLYMPDYPSKNPDGLSHFRILWSMVYMFFTEPLLIQASLMGFLLSAVFTSYWTTLSFLLSSPPYSYDSLTIGLFALIGIFIICWGPVYSRLIIDKIQPLHSSIIGISIELAGVIVGTFIGTFTVAGPVIEAVVIDLGNQAVNIANRSGIYTINPKARNRINTAYMVASFCGQLSGTAIGNRLYAEGGWRWSGGCNIGFLAFALVVCLARGPREKGWIGWSGGWHIGRDDLPTKRDAAPSARDTEKEAGDQGLVTTEPPSSRS